jgi:hypothetical protein
MASQQGSGAYAQQSQHAQYQPRSHMVGPSGLRPASTGWPQQQQQASQQVIFVSLSPALLLFSDRLSLVVQAAEEKRRFEVAKLANATVRKHWTNR